MTLLKTTLPGPHAIDKAFLAHMVAFMPDFTWDRIEDDWDAPQLVGFGEAGRELRLSSRNRSWVVTAPEADFGGVRNRLLETLANWTDFHLRQGIAGDRRRLISAMNGLLWGAASLESPAEGTLPEFITLLRDGRPWMCLFSRREAAKDVACAEWYYTSWFLLEHMLGRKDYGGVIVNPFAPHPVTIPMRECVEISRVGLAVRLQLEMTWGIYDRPIQEWSWTDRLRWQSAGVEALQRTSPETLTAELSHFHNGCEMTVAGAARQAVAEGAGLVLRLFDDKCLTFSPGEVATLLEAKDTRRDFVEVTREQVKAGIALKQLPLDEGILPLSLQRRIESEGVARLALVQSTAGLCLVLSAPQADKGHLRERLGRWLKPYQRYLLY